MTRSILVRRCAGAAGTGLAALSLLLPTDARSQSLEARVNSAGNEAVQFSFPSRPEVCGDGRGLLTIGQSTIIGNMTITGGQIRGGEVRQCERGPVRVVMMRVDGLVTSLETYVGGDGTAIPGARELGSVQPREAADYLVSLAARLDGKPGRDAIMPAALAEGADIWERLIAIARDANRPNETRSSALAWAGRLANDFGAAPPAQVASSLAALAAETTGNRQVREQALSALGRLPRGEGVPALMQMVRGQDSWLAGRAMTSLSSSGDPRARQFMRTAAESREMSGEVQAAAIRGLGRSYTTADDAAFLRGLFPRVSTSASKDAIVTAVASVGGTDNLRWLINIAGDVAEPLAVRRKIISAAERAGAPLADFAALYDRSAERAMKEEIISMYGRRNDRASVDQLLAIAKNADEDRVLRRSAITRLSRSDDPRVVAALKEIAIP
jgi:hypothetical protein